MMGSFWHILKANKTSEFPRNWCFVDTETSIENIDRDTRKQSLRLGVANYVRDAHQGHDPRDVSLTFAAPGQFWDWLLASSEQDRRLVVIAYNAAFDFRILSGFQELQQRGYVQQKIYTGESVFIATFRRGKHIITILDACNYFDGTLESWGKMLGVEKLTVNFTSVSLKQLEIYCCRDVEILRKLWQRWREFVAVNDFGHFAPTRSSQALTAYVHKYMTRRIWIHADCAATTLERAAYYGGRVECFRVGKMQRGEYYKLDVNSMYPSVMVDTPMPIKLIGVFDNTSVSDLRYDTGYCECAAHVVISTDTPIYPVRQGQGIVFPVGVFDTFLCGPELREAWRRGHVERVLKLALYHKAVIFRDFVSDLYALRKQYQREDNVVFAAMVKKIMNSLYGKFGQHSVDWQSLGYSPDAVDGVYSVIDSDTGVLSTHRVIAGTTWVEQGRRESYHSFPAISATITSAARLRLWRLIEQAGRENVFYVDTDSLIVNRAGCERLRNAIHPEKLGMLKLEYLTKSLAIYAPKDYQTDHEKKIKGVTKDARKLRDGSFQFWEWEGMAGAFREAHTDSVYMYRARKILERNYNKGQVSATGVVSPLVLSRPDLLSASSND